MRRGRVGWLLLVLFLAASSPAEARDDPEPLPEAYTMLRTSFLVAEEKEDPQVLAKAIADLAKAAAKTKREDVLTDARKLLKPHLRYTKKKEDVCLAAVKAYGVVKLENSGRDLVGLAHEKRSKRIPQLIRAYALYSIARIADRKSHDVLLDYLDAPKPDKVARYMAVAAAKAIALYAPLEPKRKYVIMYDVMGKWNNLWSAAGGAFMTSADAAEWWGATHKPLVTSFNKVLKVDLKTYQECVQWWRKNRRKVQKGTWPPKDA